MQEETQIQHLAVDDRRQDFIDELLIEKEERESRRLQTERLWNQVCDLPPAYREVFEERYSALDISCMSCPIGCKHLLKIKGGKYHGLNMIVSCSAVATIYYGGNCEIRDWDEVYGIEELCNRLGMDIISTGSLVSLAIELYEKGTISRQDTGGLELDWGAADPIRELVKDIAYRRRFGAVLAEGLIGAPKLIGKGAELAAVHVKGISPVFDLRAGATCENLEQEINFKGHMAFAGTVRFPRSGEQFVSNCRKMRIPEATMKAILADPVATRGKFAKWPADYAGAMELLGLCNHVYSRGPELDIDIEIMVDLYTALTGLKLTVEELLKASENAYDMARAFNYREGASRANDAPPPRWLSEPLDAFEGTLPPVDQRDFDAMVTQYYEERGWDPQTGAVKPDRLAELTR